MISLTIIHQSLAAFLEKHLFILRSHNSSLAKTNLPKIALAISGGADSMALLDLISQYRQFLEITIFSVDHQLRKESRADLAFVAQSANKYNFPFYALTWQHSIFPTSNIQEKARLARYQLMTDQCHQLGINSLLTAHHYDDFLENYLMKKKRNYSVLGLSLSEITYNNNIQILRPLSQFRKAELLAYLNKYQLDWREDPSNQKNIYERNRTRQLINSLPIVNLNKLCEEAERVNIQATKINQKLIKTLAERLEFSNFGLAKLHFSTKLAPELLIYLVNYALTMVSGKLAPPRYRSVSKIINNLQQLKNFTISLHGCILKNINIKPQSESSLLLIFRENQAIAEQAISYSTSIFWDQRFSFFSKDTISASYKIGKIDEASYSQLKKKFDLSILQKISHNNHKQLLFSLPTIKKLEKVVAIPHISYYDEDIKFRGNFYFAPKFTSRFTHFL